MDDQMKLVLQRGPLSQDYVSKCNNSSSRYGMCSINLEDPSTIAIYIRRSYFWFLNTFIF